MNSHLFAHGRLDIKYIGKKLDRSPCPTLVYFAVSAKDSLELDPFNQPARFFLEKYQQNARVFSITLPYHEEGNPPQFALASWSDAFEKALDTLAPFFDEVEAFCHQLQKSNLIEENTFFFAGLSRGAFIGLHLLARVIWAKKMVCFAPLLDLVKAKEFAPYDNPRVKKYSCFELRSSLYPKEILFTIGNKDDRVSTRRCFDFIEALANTAYEHRIRSPKIHARIYPSIGHQGHGTPKEIFHHGIDWL